MVKKFYMETKQGTLEQSVLDVWQNAAEQTDIKMDGRTKGYKNHRSKLEARKAKREEKKKQGLQTNEAMKAWLDTSRQKELAKLVKKGWRPKEIAKALGRGITPKEVKDWASTVIGGKATANWLNKLKKEAYEIGTDEYREYLERLTPGELDEGKVVSATFYKKDGNEKVKVTVDGLRSAGIEDVVDRSWIRKGQIQREEDVIEEPVDPKDREELDTMPGETANKMKKAKHPSAQVSEGTKEEYQKFFNAAMKKFKIDSPADLKSDEEKKKFYDYIDKNYTGEKDEELTKLAKDFKVSSMREVLTKMWTVNEGELPPALKKAIDAKKDKEKKEDKDKDKKNTLTGKKKAEVDVNPDLIAARKY